MNDPAFPDHTLETAPARARRALEQAADDFGFVPSALARLATSPAAVAAFGSGVAHFDRSTLTSLEREVVVFTVARRNGCEYCVALHTSLLGRQDVDRAMLDALRAGAPLCDARLEALRRFAEALLDTRGAVADADRAAFFAAGFRPEQALDVVVGIGAYTLSTFANRLTRAPLDPALEPFR